MPKQIKNYTSSISAAVIRQRFEKKHQLFIERTNLVEEYRLLQNRMVELKGDKTPAAIEEKRLLHQKMQTLTGRLTKIKRELSIIRDDEQDVALQVLKEAIGEEKYAELMIEVNRRIRGMEPNKFTLTGSSDIKYREVASELLRQLIQARKTLTSVIETGCVQYDRSDFMKIISPVNRLLQPVTELEKIRRINHLK